MSPFSKLSTVGRTQEEKEEKQQLESEAGTFPTQLWNWAKSRRKTGIKEMIQLVSRSQTPRYELLMSNPATGTPRERFTRLQDASNESLILPRPQEASLHSGRLKQRGVASLTKRASHSTRGWLPHLPWNSQSPVPLPRQAPLRKLVQHCSECPLYGDTDTGGDIIMCKEKGAGTRVWSCASSCLPHVCLQRDKHSTQAGR